MEVQPGRIISRFLNIGQTRDLSLSLSYTLQWGRLYLNPQLNGTIGDYTAPTRDKTSNRLASFSLPVSYHIGNHKFELSLYQEIGKTKINYGEYSPTTQMSFSYTYSLLDDRLTLKLRASDLFNSVKSSRQVFGDYTRYTESRPDLRTVSLSLLFRLNKGKDTRPQGAYSELNRAK